METISLEQFAINLAVQFILLRKVIETLRRENDDQTDI